ncbi:DUF5681 domain-containing protein [Luteolibacter luteus]|uniref:DUF5681 domain-containing protein n=1 Tax=Luteolibacter luteus TaxID=2728835 RepID=A0A858RR51_9BACT|nr:DUF5681 domain-containing protein [Luteolibacter luteus]QJE99141.1 hypothetical protein HHL09_26290 [Luteolibacter luteus]
MDQSNTIPTSGLSFHDPASAEHETRSSTGQFLPGHSGNPAGRPRGSRNAPRLRLDDDMDSIVDAVVGKALDGDVAAAKLLIDRIFPRLRAASAPIAVDLPHDAGPLPMAQSVLRAALAGEIPPDTASQLVNIASQLSRITEVELLKARLEALERATGRSAC